MTVEEKLDTSTQSAEQAVESLKAAILSEAVEVTAPYNDSHKKRIAMKKKAQVRKAKKKRTRTRRN